MYKSCKPVNLMICRMYLILYLSDFKKKNYKFLLFKQKFLFAFANKLIISKILLLMSFS